MEYVQVQAANSSTDLTIAMREILRWYSHKHLPDDDTILAEKALYSYKGYVGVQPSQQLYALA